MRLILILKLVRVAILFEDSCAEYRKILIRMYHSAATFPLKL